MNSLESFGSMLVERLGALEVLTAALLAAALLLDRALSRRVGASWRIALYAPVALRILIPLDWSLRLTNAPRVVTFLSPLSLMGGSPGDASTSSHTLSWHGLAA